MTSLFLPAGPKGSSSAASSSAANPFQALTHFYEQELTGLHIDSAPSRHHRQHHVHAPRTKPLSSSSAHLFPSASSSTCAPFSTRPTFTNASSNSYATVPKDRHGEDFKSFSHATHSLAFAHATSLSSGGGKSSLNASANADISEHMRQRQEYYLREAQLRSADRHDGLGPIVDFSQLWHKRHEQPEDHVAARHYNPYAEETKSKLSQFRQHQNSQTRPRLQQSWRASSQQEQVHMDLGQDDSLDLEHTWQETLSAMSSSSSSPSSPALTSVPTQRRLHGPAVEGSLASSFMDAAAALPSSWPLAPWAIETEAALMEFETIYKDYGPQNQYLHGQHLHSQHQQQLKELEYQQAGSWSEEFTKASGGVSSSTPPVHSPDRRGSVKTCGFLLDPKHQSLESLDDISSVQAVQARANAVAAAMAAALPTQTLDSEDPNATADYEAIQNGVGDLSLVDHFHPPMSIHPSTHQEPTTNNLVSIERPGQSFNDDIFEGDMLQAWMDTLAQEKQEADEAKEETLSTKNDGEEEISEADRQVLETAIRRLNALKHQLDSRTPPPLPPSPHFDQEV
ncbi:hypothetical protein EMPS_03749 [Entomortierella parvispora]|uniref:Uncharacterized protein n=1 Tax=Entomortierella parvispora TaxID=205924 RepID=A0A9P3H763_9FUNG|nr:hypothetical protein EMPS_03749 [Entomortierella parvispora]